MRLKEVGLALLGRAGAGKRSSTQMKSDVERAPLRMQTELDGKIQYSDELLLLIKKGEKLQAIKLYREETGVGLKEAKEAVEAIAGQRRQGSKKVQLAEASQDDGNLDEVRHLLLEGQKIQAIKAYRQITGVGLKEAKDIIERIEIGSTAIEAQGQVKSAANLVDPEELQRLIRTGQKIQAIKYYRQQRGVGLKEAKDAIDWLEANPPPQV